MYTVLWISWRSADRRQIKDFFSNHIPCIPIQTGIHAITMLLLLLLSVLFLFYFYFVEYCLFALIVPNESEKIIVFFFDIFEWVFGGFSYGRHFVCKHRWLLRNLSRSDYWGIYPDPFVLVPSVKWNSPMSFCLDASVYIAL